MIKIFNILLVVGVISSVLFLSFFDNKLSRKSKRRLLFFFFLLISAFLAIREIGLDLEVYRTVFENQRILSITELFSGGLFSSKLEPFFAILISILKQFNFGFTHFLFLTGAIPMFIIYRIIVETEEKHIIMTFSLFLLMNFFRGPIDIIRHFFAAAIYLSAIRSLANQQNSLFWKKTLLSVFFHYSNIIIVFIKPFLKFRWSKSKFYTSVIITVIIAFMSKILLLNIIGMDFWNTSNVIIWKLRYYLIYYNSQGYQYVGILHRILLSIIVYFPLLFSVVISMWALNKVETIKKSSFNYILLNSQIIGILFAVFFIVLNAQTLGMRIHFLLNIGSFFIVKEVIVIEKDKNANIVYALTILSLVFYNFVIVLYYAGVHDPMSPFYLF